MIDFPTGAYVGQTYTVGDRSWRWNGYAWARVVNEGQNIAVLVGITAVEAYAGALEGAAVSGAFHLLNYV